MNALLEQEFISKPLETLANEVVNNILNGLMYGKCLPILEAVYYNGLDSVSTKDSFSGYLERYTLASDLGQVVFFCGRLMHNGLQAN